MTNDDVRDSQNTPENLSFDISVPKIEAHGESIVDALISKTGDELRPWATVKLPSMGLYYEGEIPDGMVKVRPMGMATDKILATQHLAQSGKSLDYVLKNCVRLPNDFSPLSLLAGDRLFLLFFLRGITHGKDYEFMVDCPNCGATNDKLYDLTNTAIKYANVSLGDEPFKVHLDLMSQATGKDMWVKVRFLRGYDMLRLVGDAKNRRRVRRSKKFVEEDIGDIDQAVIDESLSSNLAQLIVEVGTDGDSTNDKSKIAKFVDILHASDHAAIREFINDNTPGIDSDIETNCDQCSHNMKMTLPITESFFRPSKQVDNRRKQ